MSGIRISQTQLEEADYDVTSGRIVSRVWDEDPVLAAIEGDIDHYWRLSQSGTQQTPQVGTANLDAVGGPPNIIPARGPIGPDGTNPCIYIEATEAAYLLSDANISPSTGSFSLWVWLLPREASKLLSFIFDWQTATTGSNTRRAYMILNHRTPRLQSAHNVSADMTDPSGTGVADIGRLEPSRWGLHGFSFDAAEGRYWAHRNGQPVGYFDTAALDLSGRPLRINSFNPVAAHGIAGFHAHAGYTKTFIGHDAHNAIWNNGLGRFL